MPFIKDTKNWNQCWEDDTFIENSNLIDDFGFDNELNLVKYNVPEKQEEHPKPIEKRPAFYTYGKIPITRSPYNPKEYIYTKKEFEFKPGVTVLVGCNGCGKTTLLHQIEEYLKDKKVPVMSFDNLHDGGSNMRARAAARGDFATLGTSLCSSEGEGIIISLNNIARDIGTFVSTGRSNDPGDNLCKAFARAVWGDDNQYEEEIPNERWILFDAIDSGLSVDNVVDLKEHLFKPIMETSQNLNVFLICACNEYELANGEQCMDTHTGKYVDLPDYNAYRKFVIDSRKIKDKRYSKNEN
jgi:energy-coupling factor transporter ATP-binding protein EcfA2